MWLKGIGYKNVLTTIFFFNNLTVGDRNVQKQEFETFRLLTDWGKLFEVYN